jgi:uncharacterized protein
MTWWWLAYLGLGAFAGFFAGLLGIGGGSVLVPLLVMAFAAQGFDGGEVLHLALGSSLASIVFTSISSVRTHHRHGAVLWPIAAWMACGVVFGTIIGTRFASVVPAHALAIFFTCFIIVVALQMIVEARPPAQHKLPGRWGLGIAGAGIGAVSCLVAIGGGALTAPFLTWCHVRIQNAIATAAAVGMPIAIGGSLGYLYNGWGNPALPPHSLGFIYLPAVIGVAAASVLTAPLGARLTHRLPVRTLKRVFAGVLVVLATKMLWGLL